MEPISTAIAAFGAIKAGISAGKEITSMAKDLGSMWDSCEAVQQDHNKKKNRQILSANEEALSTFVNKQKAKDLEAELRELIVQTRGVSAWHELLRLRADIKRERKEADALAAKEKREKQEATLTIVAVIGGALLCLGGVGAAIYFTMFR